MKSKNETFAELMQAFAYRYDLRSVFDDFLTMVICSFGRDVDTGLSYDELLYLETINKYKGDELQHHFPKLLTQLILEMDERFDSDMGNDVLGDFYEVNLYRKGAAQYFTPWPICKFMAMAVGENPTETDRPLRIIDPACGSGRMLLASAKVLGPEHEYYAIDIDHMCVKMAALNLFLNGVFHCEVMWGDALSPDNFHLSYSISWLPFGIFKIEQKEDSRLWQIHKNSFPVKTASPVPQVDLKLPSDSGENSFKQKATQTTLF